jgi:hypothetical protein
MEPCSGRLGQQVTTERITELLLPHVATWCFVNYELIIRPLKCSTFLQLLRIYVSLLGE